MDVKSLEKDELVDLTAMLGARLARSVESELMAEMRARRLERALDGARKETFWENRAKQLSDEIQGWQDKAKGLESKLYNASDALSEMRKRWEEALKERDKALNERDLNKGEVTKLLKQMEILRSAASVSDMNARRAMREEKEAKTKLESAEAQRDHLQREMQKVRVVERDACLRFIREALLKTTNQDTSNELLAVLNLIKGCRQ